jgi:hypothetical protein
MFECPEISVTWQKLLLHADDFQAGSQKKRLDSGIMLMVMFRCEVQLMQEYLEHLEAAFIEAKGRCVGRSPIFRHHFRPGNPHGPGQTKFAARVCRSLERRLPMISICRVQRKSSFCRSVDRVALPIAHDTAQLGIFAAAL